MNTQRAEGNKRVHFLQYRINLQFLLRPTKATHLSLYSLLLFVFTSIANRIRTQLYTGFNLFSFIHTYESYNHFYLVIEPFKEFAVMRIIQLLYRSEIL